MLDGHARGQREGRVVERGVERVRGAAEGRRGCARVARSPSGLQEPRRDGRRVGGPRERADGAEVFEAVERVGERRLGGGDRQRVGLGVGEAERVRAPRSEAPLRAQPRRGEAEERVGAAGPGVHEGRAARVRCGASRLGDNSSSVAFDGRPRRGGDRDEPQGPVAAAERRLDGVPRAPRLGEEDPDGVQRVALAAAVRERRVDEELARRERRADAGARVDRAHERAERRVGVDGRAVHRDDLDAVRAGDGPRRPPRRSEALEPRGDVRSRPRRVRRRQQPRARAAGHVFVHRRERHGHHEDGDHEIGLDGEALACLAPLCIRALHIGSAHTLGAPGPRA